MVVGKAGTWTSETRDRHRMMLEALVVDTALLTEPVGSRLHTGWVYTEAHRDPCNNSRVLELVHKTSL